MKYVFICKEWEEIGELGWKLEGEEDADPTTGRTVAHDIMEHFPTRNKTTFGIEEEFLAFGAMYWLRGNTGKLNNGFYDYNENMASDFLDIFNHYKGGMRFQDPPRTYKTDDLLELALDNICTEANRMMKSEVEYDINEGTVTESEILQFIEKARGWMRIGHRKAIRRYKNLDAYTLSELFDDIATWVDKVVREEGLRMIIHFKPTGYSFRGYIEEYGEWE